MSQRKKSPDDYGTVHKSYLNKDGTLKVRQGSLLEMLLLLNPVAGQKLKAKIMGMFEPMFATDPQEEEVKNKQVLTREQFQNDASVLPFDAKDGDKEILREQGIKFHGLCSHNPGLQTVKLPDGWKKMATSVPEWFHLIDVKGKIWARLYYRKVLGGQDTYMEIVDLDL